MELAKPIAAGLVDADARFEEGTALAKKGHFEAARAKFLQSYALYKSPRTLLNLSIVEKNTGRHAEALRHLRLYLKDPTSDPEKVAELQKAYFKELYAATGHFRFAGDAVAIVAVDDQPVTNLSEEWDEAPGVHRVSVQRADRKDVREYRLAAGQTVEVDLRGVAAPIHPTNAPGVVGSGEPSQSSPPPSESYWNARRYVGLGLMGAGLIVGIGGFALFQGAAASDETELEKLRTGPNPNTSCVGVSSPECARRSELANSRVTYSNFSWVMAGIGGGVLLAGGLLMFWPGSHPKKETARTSIDFSVGPGQVNVFGRF